jgi:spermidine/putrescine transport system substrate-binding protein
MAQRERNSSAGARQQDLPPRQETVVDPALWRGLTRQRLSRRGLLRAGALTAGTVAAGTAGLPGLLAGCGNVSPAAAVSDPVGSVDWWSKQRLHHTVNFANWPDYIDVLNGKHPTLEHFTAITGIRVNYTEPVSDDVTFYNSIKPSLQRHQYTGYDIIVTTTNSPALGELISNGWLTPLDQAMMSNFRRYASRLAENPPWDPGNTYTMAWQSGWTAIGYNATIVTDPGTSVGILFDSKYAGKVGMMSDLQELGSVGLLAIGVDPPTSTEADWHKAAAFLQKQKSAGIVRGYYDQSYIDKLKSGEIVVSQAYSGDIFQANLQQRYQDLQLMMPVQGGMFWTDNMCIPVYAQNPKDAMALMDYFYQPQVEAVVEYYNDYVCPVPAAQQVLLAPSGWAAEALAAMQPEIGKPPAHAANSPLVFPTPQYQARSRNYYQFENAAALAVWNGLFGPIAAS